MSKTIWTFQVFMALLMNPKRLASKVKRLERYGQRLEGQKRVLWCLTWGSTGPEQTPVSVLWIRYPNSVQECIRIPSIQGEFDLTGQTGHYADLPAPAQAYFDRYVRPRITEELAARALKVCHSPHTLAVTGLRDHPFTPSVREFYELNTTYSVTCTTSAGYAPAKYAKFSTTQETTRVQLAGQQLRLIRAGKVWNISAGRFPQIELSAAVREGMCTLALELADRKLNPGERQALATFAHQHADLSLLLCAIRFPQLIHLPGLLRHLLFAPEKVRRAAFRYRGGLKGLLRRLVGELPSRGIPLLYGQAHSALAAQLHDSGWQSPDLKYQILSALSPDQEAYGRPLDIRWYMQAIGEQAVAHRLVQALTSAAPQQVFQELQDSGTMYQLLCAAGTPPSLSGLSIKQMHDQLARLQSRLQTANLPLKTAAEQQYDRLDQDILCDEFGLLQFRRAREIHDLIAVGETLHNCVGSYARQAVCGDVIIVVARDALSVPRLCLEIRGHKLYQYKLDRNQSPRTPAQQRTAQTYLKAARLTSVGHDLPTGRVNDPAGIPAPAGGRPPLAEDLPF